jgi:hypothetical protein
MVDLAGVVGYRFPGGAYHLPPYVAWLWDDAVGAAPNSDAAHPGIAYMIALLGGGASIQDIMDLLGTSASAGVQFGEVEFTFESVTRPGTTYHVEGEVLDVERKHGRRLGAFDVATFVHRLRVDPAGPVVASITHTWVIPRRAEAE